MKMMIHCNLILTCLVVSLLPFSLNADPQFAEPLIDGHLHYSAADVQVYSPQDIIARLDHNGSDTPL